LSRLAFAFMWFMPAKESMQAVGCGNVGSYHPSTCSSPDGQVDGCSGPQLDGAFVCNFRRLVPNSAISGQFATSARAKSVCPLGIMSVASGGSCSSADEHEPVESSRPDAKTGHELCFFDVSDGKQVSYVTIVVASLS